ncbi:MAG TPA: D-glucuronyl C5-epimerase family protein [Terriglobales bacterium]|nr:D-glucuronyl C5-epimerase family protein [Terriglobales bacterium]
MSRSQYYRRIFSAYLTRGASHVSFWHDRPYPSSESSATALGEYYMPFTSKANYPHLDACGIPRLNYRGSIGWQYNPIAIAQFGLGNHTLFCRTGNQQYRDRFLIAASWMVRNLEKNDFGLHVWHHHFDWDYRSPLKAPWYSGLAQGQGISLLVRAFHETRDDYYLRAARHAFISLCTPVDGGGVLLQNGEHVWLEEYIVHPPTHILNGCMWANWGVYDYWLTTGDEGARQLFSAVARSLALQLPAFDTGFWSLYEQCGKRMSMLASPFYHRLHIAQLEIMHRLTSDCIFQEFAHRWRTYQRSAVKRSFALLHKSTFKLFYY